MAETITINLTEANEETVTVSLDQQSGTGGSGITVGTTTITSGTTTRVLYDNAGVVGEYSISGTGSVAMTNSPSFVIRSLGAATATTINGVTISASEGGNGVADSGKLLKFDSNGSISATDIAAAGLTAGESVLYAATGGEVLQPVVTIGAVSSEMLHRINRRFFICFFSVG